MQVEQLGLDGVFLFTPKAFGDDRGFFMESFNLASFTQATGKKFDFVQDNHSQSKGFVLRGLHYQLSPKAQGKLVRCIRGTIYDVAVDVRRASPTFGRWIGAELSEANKKMLWIPPGFAHGFCTLTDLTDVLYKTTDYYSKEDERSIKWNDGNLKIDWPLKGAPIVSEKDESAPPFSRAEVFSSAP